MIITEAFSVIGPDGNLIQSIPPNYQDYGGVYRDFNLHTATLEDDKWHSSVTDKHGRPFFEVSIHPFAEEVNDENGDPVQDPWWFNTSGSDYSDEYGDFPEGYPDEMFRKGWSVSSWVRCPDGGIDVLDDEEFPDYETAILRAEELATKYEVGIDHRY